MDDKLLMQFLKNAVNNFDVVGEHLLQNQITLSAHNNRIDFLSGKIGKLGLLTGVGFILMAIGGLTMQKQLDELRMKMTISELPKQEEQNVNEC